MFDVTVQAIALEVTGAEDHVLLSIILGLTLPVGPGQAAQLPAGAIRVPMGREPAIEHGRSLITAGEGIEEKKASDLVVAQNLQGVDQAARMANQFRGQ